MKLQYLNDEQGHLYIYLFYKYQSFVFDFTDNKWKSFFIQRNIAYAYGAMKESDAKEFLQKNPFDLEVISSYQHKITQKWIVVVENAFNIPGNTQAYENFKEAPSYFIRHVFEGFFEYHFNRNEPLLNLFYDHRPCDPPSQEIPSGDQIMMTKEFKSEPVDMTELKFESCEETICREIMERKAHGLKKYGQSVDDNPLTFEQWMQHMREELMDGIIYLERMKRQHDYDQ